VRRPAAQTNWSRKRAQQDDSLTLTDDMKNVLDQHLANPNQPVRSTITQGMQDTSASKDDMAARLRMTHTVKFEYSEGQDPGKYSYIRFAKATRMSGGDIQSTVPGYVSYGPTTRPGKPTTDEQINDSLNSNFGNAKWSLDGPQKQFANSSNNQNVDTPGVGMFANSNNIYPYGLKTEFYGVLYDPENNKTMNVTHYQDSFTKPSLGGPAQHSGG
jgi:hypothetical protein